MSVSAYIPDADVALSSAVRDGVAVMNGAGSVDTDDLSVSRNNRDPVFEY